jgi:RNA polymerase sigma-70 factor, ECF subfamily
MRSNPSLSANRQRPLTPVDEQSLVRRSQRELPYDTTTFEILVDRYQDHVSHACLRYLRSAEEAEEATQDVFLRVYHGIGTLQRDTSFRPWLFSIVRNECATRYRKLQRERERLDAYQQTLVVEPFATVSPTSVPARTEDALEHALAALPPAQRRILTLRYVAELPLAEVAAALKLNLSAAKMRLYRAREQLRQRFFRELNPPV